MASNRGRGQKREVRHCWQCVRLDAGRDDVTERPYTADTLIGDPEPSLRGSGSAALAARDSRASGGPERRQVTVMFCDLVGSTPLSRQLDPEDMLEVLTLYREACLPVIEHYGGFVSQYMGDGILALFGYPTAHEEDAERAVFAALGIIDAVPNLNASLDWVDVEPLRVRLGIATGMVIAGQQLGQASQHEDSIVGEAPNLAARLQSFAEPNAVVVSASTHRLLASRFEYRDLGFHDLKGFEESQRIWQVMKPRSEQTRFDASRGSVLTPMVDRVEAMESLMGAWDQAEHNHGRMVLMRGEPGIGKSRLTQELRNRLVGQPHMRLWFQCSPYFTNTALFPFIDQLTRAAGFDLSDSPSERLEKLDKVLSLAVDDTSEVLPLIAALLSLLVSSERDTLSGLSPQRRKEKTLEALLAQFEGLSAKQPLLIIIEDLHWIDPTSLELIELLADRIHQFPALCVFTSRPGFSTTWTERDDFAVIELDHLGRNYGEDLIARVVGAKRMPAEVVTQIFERTDGVPLFVEEITKTLLESELLEEREDRYVLARPLPPGAIPSTLQDSLMARLDQLPAGKAVAQIAATLGREFSLSVLTPLVYRTLKFNQEALDEALRQLIDAELLVARDTAIGIDYRFKHALVRDAAYDSLLKRKRQKLHVQIVEVLETGFGETVQTQPELLGHHCTEAGLTVKAIGYWLQAGGLASERSANVEAVAHLERGLDLIPSVSDAAERNRLELELRVALGAPLISTKGPGSAEVEADYTRALDLCNQVPDSEEHFKAQWGWWRVSMNYRIGHERADALLSLAQRLDDRSLLMQAHHCEWATLFHLGDHRACCEHVAEGLALYQADAHRHHASVYGGHDAKVCGHGERALSLWLLGYPEQAMVELEQALAWSLELGHVGSLAHARDYALVLGVYRQDHGEVSDLADQMIEFATREGLPDYRERGAMFRGWAQVRLGNVRAGLDQMTEALEKLSSFGTKEDLPMFLDFVAQAHHALGEPEKGLACIADAFKASEQAGLQFWLAELHRCRAKLLNTRTDESEIEAAFRTAISIAHAQGALTFELRAATDLAEFYQMQDRGEDTSVLLAPVLARFDGCLETEELTRARSLLQTCA